MLPDESTVVDPAIQREIHADEQLLWWAHPDPRRCSGPLEARAIGRALWIPLCSVLVLVLAAAGFFFVPTELFEQSRVISLLLLLLPLLLLPSLPRKFRRYLEMRRALLLLKQTLYAITDHRILIIVKTAHHAVNSYTFTKAELGGIEKFERRDGWGDIIFNPSNPPQRDRQRTHPAAKFVGIPAVRQVEGILLQTFKGDDW